ncbi:alpha/beta hydrolase [Paenibacillus sp. J5C_2022]|nr:alpha/beta hydrolase [Paenibacillus sp. J5C2022]MCU6708724.1 alpha/beta hydrolase [Paenibacillus sp. J5C2022]
MMWQGIKNFINVRFKGHEQAIESFIANRYWQYFFPSPEKEAARNKVLSIVRNPNNFCRFPPNLSKAAKPAASERLREIEIPTLIVIADQDHPFNIRTAEALHNTMKQSSHIMIRGCSHLPFIEKPKAFHDILMEFLSHRNSSE